MSLETELANFWDWAGMTPETYNEERGLGEWEIEYPGWDNLYKAANEVITLLNKEFNHDLAQLLVYALAIDNESGTVLQSINNKLESKLRFVRKAIHSDQPQARWQMAELLGSTEVEDREKLLVSLINRDKDKYIVRRALLSLAKVNHTKAVEFSKGFLRDPDPFMQLVSKQIINQEV
ncbi:hypothetical protein ABID22_003486 [Pontibacter aydingkolensis]|uniref:HEAT repeat domain-containing protein n=1 Tax=Pontibacter aydingkolensis TaxID=1911536 RepID=A0ABS7CUP0_9BACT|nr:HEAT repeat domain-containing protein [Pontibacter aydingkolensis]MBW7467552.1 HEAT repeat domain-containing protein [Pontibacter aydingkolensis]